MTALMAWSLAEPTETRRDFESSSKGFQDENLSDDAIHLIRSFEPSGWLLELRESFRERSQL